MRTGDWALGAVLVAAMVAGCGQRDATVAALPPASTVLALGDSLTHGTGATPETSYPAALSDETGWRVVNAGVPGETAAEGCSRLPALLDEHRPRLVLVLLGGNDFLRRLPEAGIRDALARCATYARERATPLVVIPVPRLGLGGLANAAVYDEASRELGVPLVDSGLADLLAQSSQRADRVHLNASGYRTMARTLAQNLRAHGYLAR
jgi:lysophospholipase L1-like esterase